MTKDIFILLSGRISCRTKLMSGIGLRNLHEMNKACLAILVWKLCRGWDELWCKVLIGKYTCNINYSASLAAKSYGSNLWKNILKLRPLISQRELWEIGNDNSINVLDS